MKIKHIYRQLDDLYENSFKLAVDAHDKIVIFSDLHMGNGSSKDDFKTNANLFQTALEKYYLPRDFKLILNGDVEELLRYPLKKIHSSWHHVYEIFDTYEKKDAFYKIIGNHDLALCLPDTQPNKYEVQHAVTLASEFGDLMIFHGHQAAMNYQRLNKIVGYTLKYLANPLRIKNYSVAHSSRKQYAIEKKVYHYSSYRKRVSIIGHTHRPLFESLSKVERLKYKIEQLCREFARMPHGDEQKHIQKTIKSHKKELKKIYRKNKNALGVRHLYHSLFHIPCLFNSGCVVGKRGMTCIEIENNQISLIHWFDQKTSQKYLDRRGYEPEKFENTDCYRMVLNQEALDYIFTRINLLA
jgi:UDP-2,3-diacylglucosamine pyrophosphatase LpxH